MNQPFVCSCCLISKVRSDDSRKQLKPAFTLTVRDAYSLCVKVCHSSASVLRVRFVAPYPTLTVPTLYPFLTYDIHPCRILYILSKREYANVILTYINVHIRYVRESLAFAEATCVVIIRVGVKWNCEGRSM